MERFRPRSSFYYARFPANKESPLDSLSGYFEACGEPRFQPEIRLLNFSGKRLNGTARAKSLRVHSGLSLSGAGLAAFPAVLFVIAIYVLSSRPVTVYFVP